MTATNPITGDKIQTKPSTKYADNYDAIFGKKDAGTDKLNNLIEVVIDEYGSKRINSYFKSINK